MGRESLPYACSVHDLPEAWQAWQNAGATGLVALLGQPVAHSVSPPMHQAAFAAAGRRYAYIACEVAPEQFDEALALLSELGATGCNVTIPHKELALVRASERSDVAAAVGAANCLTFRHGRWHAANTDAPGLVHALQIDHGLDLSGRCGVVVGTGGFARAAVAGLLMAGCRAVAVLGRRPEAAAEIARDFGAAGPWAGRVTGLPLAGRDADEALGQAAVCVNATPVGMWPHTDEMPFDPARLGPDCFVYDSIYHPRQTRLLAETAARGLAGAGGLSLLVRQGALSWEHWFGEQAPAAVMLDAAAAALP